MAKVGAGYSRAVSTDEAQLFSKDGADGWTGWLFKRGGLRWLVPGILCLNEVVFLDMYMKHIETS